MTEKEYALVCAIEECNELAQALSKALRFGMDNASPVTNTSNFEEIVTEYNDLLAMLIILKFKVYPEQSRIKQKMAKFNQWLRYARNQGCVVPERKFQKGKTK